MIETFLKLRRTIDELAGQLGNRTVRIMEVCGTHTMAIARHGLRDVLPPNVKLLSGPGCPVCVTSAGFIDAAIRISETGAIIATFGDLLKVPGSSVSLERAKADGADVRIVYSPTDALALARSNGDRNVVFLAIGFETTAPTTASAVLDAHKCGLANFSLLCAHKLIPPAMRLIASDPSLAVDAFLCPGHVSVIIGSHPYAFLAETRSRPAVITGFEPVDVLDGIARCLGQIARSRFGVEIQYSRAVRPEGNPRARARIDEAYRVVDESWRGFGLIPESGLAPREHLADFDACLRFDVTTAGGVDNPACRCGDVLKAIIEPSQCPLFATSCTPRHPVGACMVSTEGACAIHFRYRPKE